MRAPIKDLPLSGIVRVFDTISETVMYSGTEDLISLKIGLQIPKLIYSVNDITYIDIEYQKVYYDAEAEWYYYESFFRSIYDEETEEYRSSQTFEQFMQYQLKCEPIWEIT